MKVCLPQLFVLLAYALAYGPALATETDLPCKAGYEEVAKFYAGETQKAYEQLFENEFSPQAQAEWSKMMTAEFPYVRSDPSQAEKKVQTFFDLGFKEIDGKIVAPSYSEFVNRYISAAKKHDAKLEHTPLPALVFVHGRKGRATDHLLVTPGVDPWPTEPGYRLLSADEMFNIPFRATLTGLRNGRFPLLEASHDASHFVSFLMNPSYAHTLVDQVRRVPLLDKYPRGFSRRYFYALELLSLADPTKKAEIAQLLSFPPAKHPYSRRPFTEYMAHFDSMSEDKMLAQAERLKASYETMLVDYGGGMVRSGEKSAWPENFGGLGDPNGALLQQLGSRRSEVEELGRDALAHNPVVQLDILLKLRNGDSEELQRAAGRNRYTSEFFKQGDAWDQPLVEDYRHRLDSMIRLHLARMEYTLWETANAISAEKWITESVKPQMNSKSEVLNFGLHVFGENSILYEAMIKGTK